MDLCGGEEADPREGNVVRVCSCEFVDHILALNGEQMKKFKAMSSRRAPKIRAARSLRTGTSALSAQARPLPKAVMTCERARRKFRQIAEERFDGCLLFFCR